MDDTERLYQEIEPLVDSLQSIHDNAIELLTPMAQDLCHRVATENDEPWRLAITKARFFH